MFLLNQKRIDQCYFTQIDHLNKTITRLSINDRKIENHYLHK